MSTSNTYLAVFLGSKASARRAAWDALSEGDRRAKEREGMAAWKAWADKHHAAIVTMGGPLGKTKKVSQRGVDDTSNEAREDLSRLPRAGRDGQVASAEWLHLHRASHGPESRRLLPDVLSEFHQQPEPLVRWPVCRTRPQRAPALHRQVRGSEPAR